MNLTKTTFKILLVSLIFFISTNNGFSQTVDIDDIPKRTCISPGILHGGMSLIGFDFEVMPFSQVGFQFGAGLIGFGAGINFHVKPTIRSSFFSLQYYHQGVYDSYTQSFMGPSFCYRGKKWFTCHFGGAFLLETGPAYPAILAGQPFMLTYGIGAYFPF